MGGKGGGRGDRRDNGRGVGGKGGTGGITAAANATPDAPVVAATNAGPDTAAMNTMIEREGCKSRGKGSSNYSRLHKRSPSQIPCASAP
jgi:hypothetical protein